MEPVRLEVSDGGDTLFVVQAQLGVLLESGGIQFRDEVEVSVRSGARLRSSSALLSRDGRLSTHGGYILFDETGAVLQKGAAKRFRGLPSGVFEPERS
jgi:hypothetical protein